MTNPIPDLPNPHGIATRRTRFSRAPHIVAFLLAVAASPFANGAPATIAPTVPTDSTIGTAEPALQDHERLGLALYRADRVAWLTTDQLREHGILDRNDRLVDVAGEPLGWITSPTDDPAIWRVAYVAQVDGAKFSFADGTVDFRAEPLASLRRNVPLRPLEPSETTQFAIREDALAREWLSCSTAPYNSATIPDGKGGWNVYLMPPQLGPRSYPMHGFHRFSYDATGGFVAQYAHTRGCAPNGSDFGDAEPAALMIMHLTSPSPNEMHVFMNHSYGLPVYVATTDRKLWKIENGRIAFQSELEAEAKR